MSSVESSRPTGGPALVSDLRRLWDAGRRGDVIRAVLDRWDEVLAADNTSWLEPALRACGLSAEAFALQSGLLRRSNGPAQEWERFIESVLNSGDPWWARQLLEEAGTPSRNLQALQIEAELAVQGEGASALIAAWLEQHADEAARDAAIGWWICCGQVAAAERLLRDADELWLWRARFALWRNQPTAARALLEPIEHSPEVRLIEGIAAALEESYADAEVIFREVLGEKGCSEAAAWLVTVLRKQCRYREAVEAAEAASYASTVFDFVPRLERVLASAQERDATRSRLSTVWQSLARWFVPGREPEHARTLKEYAPALHALGLRPSDTLQAIDAAVGRFGGNHTPCLTTTDGQTLTACRQPPNARHLGASIQLVLWTRGVEAVRELYREQAPRVDGDPHFHIYQGEFELWMGAYEEAARIFEAALERRRDTLWAWIGLGASFLFQADFKTAQRVWKKGLSVTRFAGPTLYVYRGECYRRQGDVKRARADLNVALQQKPHRLSARINLALLDEQPEKLAQAEHDCIAHAPLLMENLKGDTAAKLEQVLEAMRGNRSSSPWHVSYHLWGHIWRRGS